MIIQKSVLDKSTNSNRFIILKNLINYKTLFLFLIVIICTNLLTSCDKDNRSENIQSVVEMVYNSPNSNMIESNDKMNEEMDKATINNQTFDMADSEFIKLLDQMYSSYFTEKGYESFIMSTRPYRYHLDLHELGETIEVVEIEVSKSETSSNTYSFTINLIHTTVDDEEIDYIIKGSAQFKEGSDKISFIQFFDDKLIRNIYGID